ncbi:MAG TPA: TonB-dependent siderophore receptor [Rhizobacter sp.]
MMIPARSFPLHPLARALRTGFMASLAAASAPLFAQTVAPAPAAASAPMKEALLAPIVVKGQQAREPAQTTDTYTTESTRTATPLAISPRETPQSVTVITRQRLDDEGLQSISDVVGRTTGLSVNQYETHRADFTSRGFRVSNLQVDGVPTSWDPAWSSGEVQTSLAIFDRVEVVRGATGLMTGAGEPSAAINLVRKRPGKDFAGTAEAGFGRWNKWRLLGDVGGPLNPEGTLRARLVAETSEGESWVRYRKDKDSTLFGVLEADLTPQTTATFGLSRQETDPTAPMWGGLPHRYTNGSIIDWDRSATTAPKWADWNTVYTNLYAKVQHRLDSGWQLRLDFSNGHRTADSHLLYVSGALAPDGTGFGTPFAGSYVTDSQQDDLSLNVDGDYRLFGRRHDLAFGLSHSKKDFRSDSRTAFYAGGQPGIPDFDDWDGNYPAPTSWSAPSLYQTTTTRQVGLYGVTRLTLADPLKLIVGGRLSNFELDSFNVFEGASSIRVEREFTPYVGVVWDLSQNLSGYASYTTIFMPQEQQDIDGKVLAPVNGRGAEIGLKGEFLDGLLQTTAAVFHIKQDKLALEAGLIDRGNGPEPYYVAADGATSRGFEVEVAGELARGWRASIGYTQFKATVADGTDFNSIYPRKVLRAFTTYRLPLAAAKLTLGGGVSWESRTYTPTPSGDIEQKAHALANLMARAELSKALALQVNVDNLFDEESFGMFSAFNAKTYHAPRNIRATLSYKF